jgi:hypothetical protein
MAPRWRQGADRDNAERAIHRTRWGGRRPARCRRCVSVPKRWGKAASCPSIAWGDPRRAVVWESVAAGRIWRVRLVSPEHIELLGEHRECAGNVKGHVCVYCPRGAVSAQVLGHSANTWSGLRHAFRSGSRNRSPATCSPAGGCGPPQPRRQRLAVSTANPFDVSLHLFSPAAPRQRRRGRSPRTPADRADAGSPRGAGAAREQPAEASALLRRRRTGAQVEGGGTTSLPR